MNLFPPLPALSFASADLLDALRKGLLAGVALAVLIVPPARPWLAQAAVAGSEVSSSKVSSSDTVLLQADFAGHEVSADARQVADWIAASRDHAGRPFAIIDKKAARLYVFDASARLYGASQILLGAAVGDDSVPGIGTRPIDQVRPEERTTPAGRFDARLGRNALGEDVVWVDYDAAVSMHRVRLTDPRERRLERLASPRPDDRRISYGCINVPASFFDRVLQPLFAAGRAPVYVLPELKTVQQVFGLPVRVADGPRTQRTP